MGAGSVRSGFAVAATLLALSACQMADLDPRVKATAPTAAPVALPEPKGEVIGTGPVRIALLLPLSAEGGAGQVARELKNAAALAVADHGGGAIHLVVKDTGAEAARASAAGSEAVLEGSAAMLGPLFAGQVGPAAAPMRQAGRPVIAFSSDATVAAPGIYLNSLLPESAIDRALAYAAASGTKRYVAILPQGAFGQLAETQARRTLAGSGGEILAVARYEYNDASMQAAIGAVKTAAATADGIFVPDGGKTPSVVVRLLKAAGIDMAGKRLVGSGQWSSSDLADPGLAGAIIADADEATLAGYKARYRQSHGAVPSSTSALAYDAVAALAGHVRKGGGTLGPAALEQPQGFTGYFGLFRFLPGGRTQRGLAVYEVAGGRMQLMSPAPRSFLPGS